MSRAKSILESLNQRHLEEADDSYDVDDDTGSGVEDSETINKIFDFAYNDIDTYVDDEGLVSQESLEALIDGAIKDDPSILNDMQNEFGLTDVNVFIQTYGQDIRDMIEASAVYGSDSLDSEDDDEEDEYDDEEE